MNSNSWLKVAARKIGRLDAEMILADVLGAERTDLHAHPEQNLTEAQLFAASVALARRMKGEPMAYILGWKEFFGRKFVVNNDVLIPRPETEALVEVICDMKPARLLDVGTGSGVIAVSAALELPETEVVALDISPEALGVAQENAKRLGAARISFLRSDLLEGLEEARLESFDVIAANLPYVDKGWSWNGAELKYEPEGALYAGDGGLELIKKLLNVAPKYLSEGGAVVLEADESQHPEIVKLAEKALGWRLERVLGLAMVLRRY